MWLEPKWVSMPSAVVVYVLIAITVQEHHQMQRPQVRAFTKHGLPPALLINTSNLSTRLVTSFTAARMEDWSARSSLMNLIAMSGWLLLISVMTGRILLSVRPARMMSLGLPAARKIAVWAPRPLSLGPVMRTRCARTDPMSYDTIKKK